MDDSTLTAAAIASHSTATDDGAWDGPKQEANLPNDAGAATLRKAYAWIDPDKDADTKAAYRFVHHFVDSDGKVGAASTKACSTGIGVLNGGRGGSTIPSADRQGTFNHLKRHLVDSGVDPEDVPELKSAELAVHLAAAHGPVRGMHSHAHPTYGTQGGDRSHDHMHRHDDDAHHGHDHSMNVPGRTRTAGGWPTGQVSMVAAAGPDGWAAAGHDSLAAVLAAAHTAAAGGSLVAAAMEALGSPWGIEQRGDESWVLLGRDGETGTFVSYQDAVDRLGGLAFVDQRPVLSDTWRSDMAYEDVETGDGRYIAPGALQYRDCPLPLMLQTTTDVGHFGAVLAGSVTKCATSGGTAVGSGEFDDSEAGNQAVAVVEARGRFGVSIDGMSPAEAEFECTQRDDEDGSCVDGRMRFNLLTVGGLTMTPFPAFKDAFIALEQRAAAAAGDPDAGAEAGAEAASGDPETPCEDCAEALDAVGGRRQAAGGHVAAGKEDPAAVGKAATVPFTAAGAFGHLLVPPSEWFADPRFGEGDDSRLVLQPDGRHWACPSTVTADGEVFGHMASWQSCHTGYQDRCVTPPRSKTGYAAFMLRPVMCADGTVAHVGHLTMGCGHAATDRPMAVDEVRAHYDGGPGAVRVAQVCVGEDRFGIWFHGSVDPAATVEQVREFAACSVSGDWREVWRGKGLDLVACLAGVTVPGFPVASALAAAGLQVVARDDALPQVPVATFTDGRPAALVAAGVVRRPLPWESSLAAAMGRIDRLEERLAHAERVTSRLRGLAASVIADGAAANGSTVSAGVNGDGR